MGTTWNVNHRMREHAQMVSATYAENSQHGQGCDVDITTIGWFEKHFTSENMETHWAVWTGVAQERVGDVASGDAGATTTGSAIGRGRLRDCRLSSKRWPPLALHIMSRP